MNEDTISERLSRTCAVIVNYRTPDLIERAVRSFMEAYPGVRTIVVDNGSEDESVALLERLERELAPALSVEFLKENLGHGPAMHRVIARREFDYYFFLDSDTETRRGGFLEEMLAAFDDPSVYAVGEIAPLNKRGFLDPKGIPVLVAAFMLIRESSYRALPPFEHHGAPTLANFTEAERKGMRLVDFPIQDYIAHLCRGTASRFGYGLGVKGKVNYVLNKLGM